MKKLLLAATATIAMLSASAQKGSEPLKCDKATYDNLLNISKSPLAGGEIMLFTTTHQDIGWLDHPNEMKKQRDTAWIRPTIEKLYAEPDYKAEIEQSSIVMEFFDRNPDQKERFKKLVKEGRLTIGNTYTQPYEEMYSGEAIVRQFYFGKLWTRENLDGYEAKIYYNPDVPGRTLQMSQILSKTGTECMLITRHGRGTGDWSSPDGSSTMFYSSGHYSQFYDFLNTKTFEDFASKIAVEAQYWTKNGMNTNTKNRKAVMPAMLNYEFIWDQSPIANIVPYTTAWNSITSISCDGEKTVKVNLPKYIYATAEDFVAALKETSPVRPQIAGERPAVWLYIHGPAHERAVTSSRRGDILVAAAEKFATANALVSGTFAEYPDAEIDAIWMDKIYPDHGWGGKNGDITDEIFLKSYLSAEANANLVLSKTLASLASKVQTDRTKGTPVVVFNSLSWDRTSPVAVKASFAKGEVKNVAASSADGKQLTTQATNVERYDDGSIRTADVEFMAENIPSIGYNTYYLKNSEPKTTAENSNIIDNKFYKIELANGGIKQIYDKELGQNLLDNSKFLGGEVFTMQSVGNGAGEFDAVQPVTMEGFDKVSNHNPQWVKVEDGELFTTYKLRSSIRYAVIEQQVKVYHDIKKIDFDIELKNWDAVLYREFRMAMPMASKATVNYEVPFGVLTVGKDEWMGVAGERYLTPNEDIHPRGIETWIGASNDKFGITLSSSVAVADYIDPTTNPTDKTILQPVLMASRRSCHGEGNEYRQFGDHKFHFSLTSHAPGKTAGHRVGRQGNETPFAVFNPEAYASAKLSESASFFGVSDPNTVITAVKRAESGDDVVIRMYNISGQEADGAVKSDLLGSEIIRTNMIEDPAGDSNTRLGKYAIETFKIKAK